MAEIGTKSFQDVDTKSAYAHSFGALADNTRYHDGFKSIDAIPQLKSILDVGMKALTSTTGGTGTAGNAMVPVYVDPRITDVTRKYTPIVEMVPRVTNIGKTADYNRLTAKDSAITAIEDAPAGEHTDTYERQSTAIKYLYAYGRVTGQARAMYPSYMLEGFQANGSGLAGSSFSPMAAPNAKQLDVVVRAQALREKEESLIVNGDASTDATEYSGIVKLQSSTNTVDKNTAAVEYDDTETAINYAFVDSGRPNFGISSSGALKDLRKIVIDTFNYRPIDMQGKLPFGVNSSLVLETMVGPVPMLPSQYLSEVSGSKAIYFLDMNHIEMRVLQDMTYEDLAKVNDSDKFQLKIYEALIMKNTAFNSSITEISA